MLQILVGCLIGLVPPSAVEWYRGIVMAHIEFTANGVLMVVFGFLVAQLRLAPVALKLWFVLLQAGTWLNGGAGAIAGFVGSSSALLASLNEKFPPPHGTGQPLVTLALILCAVAMIVMLAITLYGLWKRE